MYINVYTSRFYFAIFIGDISFHARPKPNAIVIARDLNCTSNFSSGPNMQNYFRKCSLQIKLNEAQLLSAIMLPDMY